MTCYRAVSRPTERVIRLRLLRVWSDMLMAANERRLTLLCMLDMSAAFDCVDHSILLHSLQLSVGITGVVLAWITSFLTGGTQQVAYNSQLSVTQTVMCGVPQGSVIGPLLYVLYTAKLSEVITRHGLNVHQYTDDTQLYLSVLSDDASVAIERLDACLVDVKAWLKASRLRLNPTKTQLCSLGQHNTWLRWILMRCHYWHRESTSSMLRKISASSLTASCLCVCVWCVYMSVCVCLCVYMSLWVCAVSHVVTTVNAEGACLRTIKYLQAVLSGIWILDLKCISTCLM